MQDCDRMVVAFFRLCLLVLYLYATHAKGASFVAVGRFNHKMIFLPNGKVLVAGGFDDAGNPLLSAEIYDPAAGVWSSAGRVGAGKHAAGGWEGAAVGRSRHKSVRRSSGNL
jgi:hypothetical protein